MTHRSFSFFRSEKEVEMGDILVFLAFILVEMVRLEIDTIEIHLILWAITAGLAYLFAREEFRITYESSRSQKHWLRRPPMFLALFFSTIIIGSSLGELIGIFVSVVLSHETGLALLAEVAIFSVVIGSGIGSSWLSWKATCVTRVVQSIGTSAEKLR